jgi:uncharacterized RDD family membrane protein YckC
MQNESVNDDVFTPASIVGRVFASIVDVVFVAIALFVVSLLIGEVAPRRAMEKGSRELFDLIFWASFFVLPVLYLAVMESSKLKATIGKLIIGVKVLDENTFQRIGFFRALGRAVVKVVSVYFCAIGVLLFLLLSSSERKQAIHDRLFKTSVVDV